MDISQKTVKIMSYLHLLLASVVLAQSSSFKPNIIIITVDDMGFHDIPYNGAQDVSMPNIQRYAAANSVILQNYYVSPDSHSSRAALLTGKHPANIGYQMRPDDATVPYGLDTDYKLLPQYLKDLGYATHAVGQWDLGFYSPSYLPTKRGYDSFYGSYLPYGHYKSHTATDAEGHAGLDLHDDKGADFNIDGDQESQFKTELYIQKAVEIINNHNADKPLHLYVALQAAQIHDELNTCNSGAIPNQYYYDTKSVTENADNLRKCYVALLSAVDQAYGSIMNGLKNNLLLLDSVVIFTTTSGGAAAGSNLNLASNAPFRGSKSTIWEGGLRGLSFVYSSLPNASGTVHCLTHISDWLPTIMHIYANTTHTHWDDSKYSHLYGEDAFECLFGNRHRARETVVPFLYGSSGAIISDGYKLLIDLGGARTAMNEMYSPHSSCQDVTAPGECNPKEEACLVKLTQDICESNNFAQLDSSRFDVLKYRLEKFNRTVLYQPMSLQPDDNGNPVNLPKSAWQPWIDVNSCRRNYLSIILVTILALRYLL